MNDSAKFTITGAITQKFVSPGGKFAALKVETKVNGFRALHNLKTFDNTVVRQIETCGIGEVVNVAGELGTEALRTKSKEDVLVDNFKVYIPSLKITSITSVAGKPANDPIDDDDGGVPF